ncbi:MAG: 4-hydroxy-tetrahydrodipicolinate reductase, partial [Actinomycetota bacterium]|nr:4-hydroxy-tetrahydrodipicolinate reductase [Actinomycetota bacterium]
MTTSAPLRVGVTGARGRMGAAVGENVSAAPGMELAAAIDIGDSLDELVAQSCDVVIDFTTP